MRKPSAIAGSAVFFIVAPCLIAGLAPWGITRWQDASVSPLAIIPAAILILSGIAVLLHAFARFALEGGGTPAPVAPTERLVIGGIYRHVRNPMYVAVIAIIFGQALLFSSSALVLYGALVAAAMVAFVLTYEEPTLSRRYGASYQTYRQNVPGWLPRLTPWRG